MISYKTPIAPDPDAADAPKTRHCLQCQSEFQSSWAGERICPKCKGKSAWRIGNLPRFPSSVNNR